MSLFGRAVWVWRGLQILTSVCVPLNEVTNCVAIFTMLPFVVVSKYSLQYSTSHVCVRAWCLLRVSVQVHLLIFVLAVPAVISGYMWIFVDASSYIRVHVSYEYKLETNIHPKAFQLECSSIATVAALTATLFIPWIPEYSCSTVSAVVPYYSYLCTFLLKVHCKVIKILVMREDPPSSLC